MAKIRCFLCGGRVANGVCTECGMPQRQHAENYNLNKSDCDGKPLTHVHDDCSYRTEKDHRQPTYAERQRKKEYRKASGSRAGKQTGMIVLIVVIVVLIAGSVASSVGKSMIEDKLFVSDRFDNDFDLDWGQESEEVYGPLTLDDSEYVDAIYDIPESGVSYEAYLAAGNYQAGCQIPEGTYKLVVIYGCGEITVENDEQGIYISEWLDYEEAQGYSEIDHLKLYQGSQIQVSGGVELRLLTENAQSQKMAEDVPNELTESVMVDGGPLLAGKDFPAGVYDIYGVDGFGVVDLYRDADDDMEWEYDYIDSQLLQSSDDADTNGRMEDYALKISNVELNEGVYIDADDMSLELIPSETVFLQEGE